MATTDSTTAVNSIYNTPQANADFYSSTSLTEDVLGIHCIDVLSNDLGGNAKTLYSLDNGDSTTDLLSKDLARAESTSSDTSQYGAKIWITAEGKVGYDAGTLNTAFKAQLQTLAAGEFLYDTFTYAIRLGNGTLAWNTVTVRYAGVNDAPTVISFQNGGVTEDASAPNLSTTGSITFDDIDLSDTHSVSNIAAAAGNSLGGVLTASVTDPATNAGDGTVTWSYTVANSATQSLAAGETVTESFTVTISDNNGGTVSQVITVTVTGTNDAPVLTVDATGGVTEDDAATLTDTGSLSFTDVDTTDTHSVTKALSTAVWSGGTLTAAQQTALSAAFTVDGNSWDFSLANTAVDFLADGETITLTFNVTVTDDSGTANASDTETVTITITGTNDAPVLTVDATGGVTEDAAATLTDSGTLSFTDVDTTDTHQVTEALTSAVWSGGTLTAAQETALGDAFSANGTGWSYSLANSAVDFLAAGETITLTFDVTVTDDSGASNDSNTETVTITITGTNDAAVIGGANTGAVFEDGDLTADGTLTINDVDGADSFQADTLTGDYGTLALQQDGSWVYTLDNDDAGLDDLDAGEDDTDVFTVLAADGTSHQITITVNGANEPVSIPVTPVAQNDLLLVNNGAGTATFSAAALLGNDTDPNGDPLHIVSVAAIGAVTVSYDSATGLITYGGNAGSFTYTVADSNGNETTATVTVQVVAPTSSSSNDDTYVLSGSYQGSYINAQAGTDSVTGGGGIDTLIGGNGSDTLVGGSANDRLIGGDGKDTMTGGDGVDTFVYNATSESTVGANADVINGFVAGVDKIDVSAIDAKTGGPGSSGIQDFAIAGNVNGVVANSITWFYDSANGVTRIRADTDGNTTADFEIILSGNVTLSASDFIL